MNLSCVKKHALALALLCLLYRLHILPTYKTHLICLLSWKHVSKIAFLLRSGYTWEFRQTRYYLLLIFAFCGWLAALMCFAKPQAIRGNWVQSAAVTGSVRLYLGPSGALS